MSGSNLNMLLDTFTVELHKLNDWLLNNKLVINVDKTQFMLFTKRKVEDDNLIY